MRTLDFPLWYYEHYPKPLRQALTLFLGPYGNDNFREHTYLLSKTEGGAKLFVKQGGAPLELAVDSRLLNSAYKDRFSAAWVRRNFVNELWVAYQTGQVGGYRQEPAEIVVLRNGRLWYSGVGYDPQLIYLATAFPNGRQHLELAPILLLYMSNDGRTLAVRNLETGEVQYKTLEQPYQLVRAYPVDGKIQLWFSPEGSGSWLGVQVPVVEPERRYQGRDIYYNGNLITTLPVVPDHVSLEQGPDGVYIAYEYGGKTYVRKPTGAVEGPLEYHSPVLVSYSKAQMPTNDVVLVGQKGTQVFVGNNLFAEIQGYLLEVQEYKSGSVVVKYKTPAGYGLLEINLHSIPRPGGPLELSASSTAVLGLRTTQAKVEVSTQAYSYTPSGATLSLRLANAIGLATAATLYYSPLISIGTRHENTQLNAAATNVEYRAADAFLRYSAVLTSGEATAATQEVSTTTALAAKHPWTQLAAATVNYEYSNNTQMLEKLDSASGTAVGGLQTYNAAARVQVYHAYSKLDTTWLNLAYASSASVVEQLYAVSGGASAAGYSVSTTAVFGTKHLGASMGALTQDITTGGSRGLVAISVQDTQGQAKATQTEREAALNISASISYALLTVDTLKITYSQGLATLKLAIENSTGQATSNTSSVSSAVSLFAAKHTQVTGQTLTQSYVYDLPYTLDASSGLLLPWQLGPILLATGLKYQLYAVGASAQAATFNKEALLNLRIETKSVVMNSENTHYEYATAATVSLKLYATTGSFLAVTTSKTAKDAVFGASHSAVSGNMEALNAQYSGAVGTIRNSVHAVVGTAAGASLTYNVPYASKTYEAQISWQPYEGSTNSRIIYSIVNLVSSINWKNLTYEYPTAAVGIAIYASSGTSSAKTESVTINQIIAGTKHSSTTITAVVSDWTYTGNIATASIQLQSLTGNLSGGTAMTKTVTANSATLGTQHSSTTLTAAVSDYAYSGSTGQVSFKLYSVTGTLSGGTTTTTSRTAKDALLATRHSSVSLKVQ